MEKKFNDRWRAIKFDVTIWLFYRGQGTIKGHSEKTETVSELKTS